MRAPLARSGRQRHAPSGPTWLLRYLPIPFVERGRSFDGCDCRGLVLLILEHERGLVVPEPEDLYRSTASRAAPELAQFAAREAGRWRPVDLAPFAVLSFAVLGQPAHVGLALGGTAFVHTQAGKGVQVSDLHDAPPGEVRWGDQLLGAFAYAG